MTNDTPCFLTKTNNNQYKTMMSLTSQLLLWICIFEMMIMLSSSFYIPSNSIRLRSRLSVRVWIEPAEEGFVDDDENLMFGEVCIRAVKAFASDPDDENNKRLLCAGALVQRPSSNICDCWMGDATLSETNIQSQGAMLVLDDLFHFHLERSNANSLEKMISTFIVQSGAENDYQCASDVAALNRGFKPLRDLTYDRKHAYAHLEHLDLEHEDLDALVFDIATGAERYSNTWSNANAISISDMIQRMKPKPMLQYHFE